MFVRVKDSHGYKYLQIVENKRDGDKIRQHVFATLGRVDALLASGKVDDLVRSLAKFSPLLKVIDAQHEGSLQAHQALSTCPALVFERALAPVGYR